MELGKVGEGFTAGDTLTVKAQVQVVRDRPARPFPCLDAGYRRELLRVYLSNVEGLARRFVDEKREYLQVRAGQGGGGRRGQAGAGRGGPAKVKGASRWACEPQGRRGELRCVVVVGGGGGGRRAAPKLDSAGCSGRSWRRPW